MKNLFNKRKNKPQSSYRRSVDANINTKFDQDTIIGEKGVRLYPNNSILIEGADDEEHQFLGLLESTQH